MHFKCITMPLIGWRSDVSRHGSGEIMVGAESIELKYHSRYKCEERKNVHETWTLSRNRGLISRSLRKESGPVIFARSERPVFGLGTITDGYYRGRELFRIC